MVNEEEYETIRKALLSLMCVGDQLKFIRTGVLGSISSNFDAECCHSIYKCTITDMDDDLDGRIKVERGGYYSTMSKTLIDHYKGELYIWHTPSKYTNYSRFARLEALHAIFNSPNVAYCYDKTNEDAGGL
jgi:hypothetical protein